MNKSKLIIVIVILTAIIGGVWGNWYYDSLYPSTKDAYVKANIVTIAAQVTGEVKEVHITDNQKVTAGQLLVSLDGTLYQNTVDSATAQLESAQSATSALKQQVQAAQASVQSAQSALDTAEKQLARIEALEDKKLASQSALDNARTRVAQARASLNQALAQHAQTRSAQATNSDNLLEAQAQLNSAQTNLKRTKIYAPADGWVENLSLRAGSAVTAYAPLFALVESSQWWVEANFKETDLQRIKAGQSVSIQVDMLADTTLTGKVESISSGSGSTFALLPAENASGNWVKVTQRFGVRIALPDGQTQLRAGASATATVDTKSVQ